MPIVRAELGLQVPVADGVSLNTDVVRPAGPGRCPALVVRTPYDLTTPASSALQVHALRMAEAGYAVVLQDVRGRGRSGGSFRPFVNEQDDGIDTILWTADQPWCNGRVGMAGISYLAFVQSAVATARPEPLQAWLPALAPCDVRTGWIREGGAFNLGFNLAWALGAIAGSDSHAQDPAGIAAAFEDPRATAGRGLLDQPELDKSPSAAFFADWVAHPDPYADDRRVPRSEDLTSVAAPALVIPGWFDVFQPSTFELYAALAAHSASPPHRLLAGPWDHSGLPLKRRAGERDFGGEALVDLASVQRSWFDVHLRDEGELPPTARAFFTGANAWETFPDWPPPSSPGRWYLGSAGLDDSVPDENTVVVRIDPEDPAPSLGGRVFPWEPVLRSGSFPQERREQREDVLCFTSPSLESDLWVAGPVTANIHSEGDDAAGDVFVTLAEVDRGGISWNVADGISRRADLQTGASFRVELGHLAHCFARGTRIRVDVSFADFPRFDVLPTGTGIRTLTIGPETFVDLSVVDGLR